ncbi:MAG TPA: hypothetical protein VF768_10905, partial [Holophagaceae bacterium]
LPRVLLMNTPEGDRLVADLEAAGFRAFAANPSDVPTDRDRIVARRLAFAPEGCTVTDAQGQDHPCPGSAMAALVRGYRTVESTEIEKTTERKLDLGKAILTSGLMVTKTVVTSTERRTSAREPFLLLQRNDGQPPIQFYEHRLHYQGLGPQLQHSRTANFAVLLERLRSLAPAAPVDDRILRPGFLAGLPPLGPDPADLALFLVLRARALGC